MSHWIEMGRFHQNQVLVQQKNFLLFENFYNILKIYSAETDLLRLFRSSSAVEQLAVKIKRSSRKKFRDENSGITVKPRSRGAIPWEPRYLSGAP